MEKNKSKLLIKVPDPAPDNVFKLMLGTKKKITKNFLNTLFYPISKK